MHRLPCLSSCGTPTSTASTIYQISPSLHAPYTGQGAFSVERQFTKAATLSVTYLNSRGFDQFITVNANAPYPGTPCTRIAFHPAQATSTAMFPKPISSRTSSW